MVHATEVTAKTLLRIEELDPIISDYSSKLIHAYFDIVQVLWILPRITWIPIFKLRGHLKLPLVRPLLLLLVSSHIQSSLSALEKACLTHSSLHPKGQTKDFWEELRTQAKSMREGLPGRVLPAGRISLVGFALIIVFRQLVPQEYYSSAISLIIAILSLDMKEFAKLSDDVLLKGIAFIIVIWAIIVVPLTYHFRIKRTLFNRYKLNHLEMLQSTTLPQFVKLGEVTISQSIYSLERHLFNAIGEHTYPEKPVDVWAVYPLCGVWIITFLYLLREFWGDIEGVILCSFYLIIFLPVIYKVWRNGRRRLTIVDMDTL